MAWIKDAWNFLWKSDSAWSWVADFAIAFLLVRFVFFPLLSLTLSTSLPLVVVESGSMEHSGDPFGLWWAQKGQFYLDRGISEEQFKEYPFPNGFDKGDIIISMSSDNYQKGDVIIFQSNQPTPIIHRLIYQNDDLTFATKGDHNAVQLEQEKRIPKEAIISKAVFRIPKLGWLKLFFVELIRSAL